MRISTHTIDESDKVLSDLEQQFHAHMEEAMRLKEEKLVVDGILIALTLCRRFLIEKHSTDIQGLMGQLVNTIDQIGNKTFHYPSFIDERLQERQCNITQSVEQRI